MCLLGQTGLRCVDCGYNCHEKCVESVASSCTRYKAGGPTTALHHTPPAPALDTASIASGQSVRHSVGLRLLHQVGVWSIVLDCVYCIRSECGRGIVLDCVYCIRSECGRGIVLDCVYWIRSECVRAQGPEAQTYFRSPFANRWT